MNLEVGMYIRYVPTMGQYEEKISKITKMENSLLDMAYYLDNEKEQPVYSSYFDEIIKARYNLIDLTKVGDYVNGYKVIGFDESYFNGLDRRKEPMKIGIIIENGKFNFENRIKKEDIKTILTKEQYENNCYKVIEK